MHTPTCIHCGAENPQIRQRISVRTTYYMSYEETFYPSMNACGCEETCEGCVDEDNHRFVYILDDENNEREVPPHRGEELEGTHPVHDYGYSVTEMEVDDEDTETDHVEFISGCCHISRSSIEELVRLEDGPAEFSNGNSSAYIEKPKPKVLEVSRHVDQPISDMDKVLAEMDEL